MRVQAESGSPPHAWRRLHPRTKKKPALRFTSTRVETLLHLVFRGCILPVHLHTRGDAPVPACQMVLVNGSPPHAWRRSIIRLVNTRPDRFTSTRVETLVEHRDSLRLSTVHLHTRGDARYFCPSRRSGYGSPPHAWRRFAFGTASPLALGSPPHAWRRY